MESLEKHLSLLEIAELIGLSIDRTRRLWRKGQFGKAYIDVSENCSGREPRIPESAVRDYLNRRSFNLTTTTK